MFSPEISQIINYISSQVQNNNKRKILLVVPGSAGDILLCTSMFSSLRELYSDFDIYFSCEPQFRDILKNNPHLTGIIDFHPIMKSCPMMEGYGEWSGIFDICFLVTVDTQYINNYIHNDLTNIGLNLRKI